MISFKQFLTEASAFDVEKFYSDCKFTLDFLPDDGKTFLYHGTKSPPSTWEIKQWKPRVNPRNTPMLVHNKLNNIFSAQFGEPIRNWLFCTGRVDDAFMYGTPTIIFPIGKFDWVCAQNSDLYDLTTAFILFRDNAREELGLGKPAEVNDLALANLSDLISDSKWWHNEHLFKCLVSSHEIMLKCDKFYSFNLGCDEVDQVKEILAARARS